eukprot:950041-Rhodomonas_salina.1
MCCHDQVARVRGLPRQSPLCLPPTGTMASRLLFKFPSPTGLSAQRRWHESAYPYPGTRRR